MVHSNALTMSIFTCSLINISIVFLEANALMIVVNYFAVIKSQENLNASVLCFKLDSTGRVPYHNFFKNLFDTFAVSDVSDVSDVSQIFKSKWTQV